MLGALRPLLPRLYSISSSQLEAPGRVAATVAVVRYESLNRRRIGVTSTQLAERLQARNHLHCGLFLQLIWLFPHTIFHCWQTCYRPQVRRTRDEVRALWLTWLRLEHWVRAVK